MNDQTLDNYVFTGEVPYALFSAKVTYYIYLIILL